MFTKYISVTILFLLMLCPTLSIYGEDKLDYRYRQVVERREHSIKEVEGKIAQWVEQEKKMTLVQTFTPGLGLTKDLNNIMADLEKNKVPKDHSRVAALIKRVEDARTNIADVESRLKPKFEAYDKMVNIAHYPDYKNDLEQLTRLYKKYNNASSVLKGSDVEKADALLKAYDADVEYFNSMNTKYKHLQRFNTNEWKNIVKHMKWGLKPLQEFGDVRKEYASKLPEEINAFLHDAGNWAEKAKTENRPAFFTGGVRQALDRAQGKLNMLKAIKGETDEDFLQVQTAYDAKKAEIDKMASSMEEAIIASVQNPEDVYSGGDKAKLKDMIESAWKKAYPDDQILAIRFHATNWKRTTEWKYNSVEWYKIDTSALVVKVMIKTSDTIVTIYPAYINKNHMQSDKTSAGVGTKKGGYVVEKMLLSNFKP